jgi:hypothetical protein
MKVNTIVFLTNLKLDRITDNECFHVISTSLNSFHVCKSILAFSVSFVTYMSFCFESG